MVTGRCLFDPDKDAEDDGDDVSRLHLLHRGRCWSVSEGTGPARTGAKYFNAKGGR